MSYNWYFAEVQRGYTLREPINSEFFSTEAIKNHAEAVVREAVQNSLDARARDASVVRVHLSIVKPASSMEPFTGGLTEHLKAKRNGLRDHSFLRRDSAALVVEDFGTTGLTGDPSAFIWRENVANPFYSFFRAEGHSDKGESDRGRWGVGKFVFPRCSRGSTYFGLSVRYDDNRALLMGRSILRSHHVGGTHYVPDGYFGIESDRLILPVEDPEVLNRFRNCFRLRRRTEPGLSVVVPWIDDEIEFEKLAKASVSSYFHAILSGSLELAIEEGTRSLVLTKATLLGELSTFGPEFEREQGPLVQLAHWAVSNNAGEPTATCLPPDPSRAPKWGEGMLSKEAIETLKGHLEAGRRVRVRVPVQVRTQNQQAAESSFDVIMEKAPDSIDDRPVFIREGIVITDARGRAARGVRSLVLVEKGPLGTLLGDAENPSHTEWRQDTANFKEKYVHGPSHLTFVRESVARINGFLLDAEDKIDRQLLADFFSIPKGGEGETSGGPGRGRPRPSSPPGDITIPRSPARLQLAKVRGGFRVSNGHPEALLPSEVVVRVAYDVRRGNPLANWHPADFDLGGRDIKVTESLNVSVESRAGNTMRFRVTGRPFAVALSGFDENRDLYVKADVISTDHASSTSQLH